MKPRTIDKAVDAGTLTGSIILTAGCMLWMLPLLIIIIGLCIALFQ